MSKYKYTSLLSSEYRSVFKSYHSVDRYGNEPSLNTSISQQNRLTHSELKYVPIKRNYKTQDNFRTVDNNVSYKPQKYDFKTDNWRRVNTSPFEYNNNFDRSYQTLNKDQEKLLSRIRNKYESNSIENFNTKLNTDPLSTINIEKIIHNKSRNQPYIQNEQQFLSNDQIPCKIPYIEFNTVNHKNYELKMKLSQINKKRNNIKLKMRVNDIDSINRKYNYLQKQAEENYRCNKNHQTSKNYETLSTNNTLQQISPNKIILKLQKKILQNMTNKKIYTQSAQHYHDEQNIQTPHFNHAEAKIKQIDASLIEKKLQNFVKNTFTDRY